MVRQNRIFKILLGVLCSVMLLLLFILKEVKIDPVAYLIETLTGATLH